MACRSKLCRRPGRGPSRNGTDLLEALEARDRSSGFGCDGRSARSGGEHNGSSLCPRLSFTDAKVDKAYIARFPCDVWEVSTGSLNEFVVQRPAQYGAESLFSEEGCAATTHTLVVQFRKADAVFSASVVLETRDQVLKYGPRPRTSE
jgi:hypothetical protein